MKFVDEAKIEIEAGDGGNGCVAFRREKYVPRGGPSGGDGGNGGHVVIRADRRVGTLLEFRYAPKVRAKDGQNGMGRDRNGRRGESLELKVPVGTLIIDDHTDEVLADLDQSDSQFIAAKGGRGGIGNLQFKRPWNRSPREATEGRPGGQRTLRLELKLLADIGIIGLPNVGKSTLISRLSAAKPKIADYPFTTLVPNLGVLRVDEGRSLVVADIPGLVPGAAEGAGLGARFLRHVERTAGLLHLLAVRPGEVCDPLEDLDLINSELEKHDSDLAARRQLVALTKADLPDTREIYDELSARLAERGQELLLISGVTGEGLDALVYRLWDLAQGEAERDDIEEP